MGDATDLKTPTATPTGETPASIQRIQRLERLERERLEEKERREERRRQVIAGAKPSGGRHDLVDRIEQITKFPMTVLGVAWLVLAIVVLSTDVNGTVSTVAVGVLFAFWVIVLVVAVGACGRGGPTTIQRRNEAMIAANRRMVDPCAIPTRAELRELGMPPWKIDRVRQQMRGWSADGVASALRAVATADAAVKGGGDDPAYALERAVVAVARAARSNRPGSGSR